MARCVNNYSLPVRKKNIILWYKSTKSHKMHTHVGKIRHSIDFVCNEGTPVYVALGGVVVWNRSGFRIGGPNKKYWYKGNRIVIRHKNGEFTAYEHLKYKGVVVKVGDLVSKHQLIGYSGNTGYSDRPHLHFEVFNNPAKDLSEGTTLWVSFKALRKQGH